MKRKKIRIIYVSSLQAMSENDAKLLELTQSNEDVIHQFFVIFILDFVFRFSYKENYLVFKFIFKIMKMKSNV